MSSPKLFQLLGSLSRKEWRAFDRYLRSPYFNRNERLVALAAYLKKFAPNFDEAPAGALDKPAIFRVIYGTDEGFNEQQVYDHISFLMRQVEAFLAQRSFDEDGDRQRIYLLRALTGRRLHDHFGRKFKQAKKALKKRKTRGESYFFSQFLLAREAFHAYGTQHHRGLYAGVEQTTHNLEAFYTVARLRYTCELINRHNILKEEATVALPESLLQRLRHPEDPLRRQPLIELFYRCYLLLTEPEAKTHYENFVSLLEEHYDLLTEAERTDLYGYAQNYCTLHINRGESSWFQQIFDLYRSLLRRNMLTEEGVFDHRIYKNIVTVGLRLQKFDWVLEFLETYKDQVTPTYRETAYFLNLAAYHFEQGAYRQALRTLLQAELDDPFYNLTMKVLLLKTYYELDDLDALESLTQTLRVYFKRDKTLAAYHLEGHRNLLRHIRKITRLRTRWWLLPREDRRNQWENIQRELAASSNVAQAQWLREKLAEIGEGDWEV